MVGKLPSSKLYKILASSHNFLSQAMTTMMRMKENVLAHQHISIQNTKEHISTQYNIIICIYYICVYVYRRDDCIGVIVEMVGL